MVMDAKTIKYPRTPHLPGSPGFTADDVRATRIALPLLTSEVIVTEKLDGENTALARAFIHARSGDSSTSHPARHYAAGFWGKIAHLIPPNVIFFGENLYAQHAIRYTALPDYLILFGVLHIPTLTMYSWDQVCTLAATLGLPVVPVLYRGNWNEQAIQACYTGKSGLGGEQEGYVVRCTHAYALDAHGEHTAKWVRAAHVATGSKHWSQAPLRKNGLAKQE